MPEQEDAVEKFGLVTPARLKTLARERQPYIIENLILKPSINILSGHSGLGKSPLVAQLAMCVASGIDFFGYKISEPGKILYCDTESTPAMMDPMLEQLAGHLGLPKVPNNFILWNPNWNIDNKSIVITQNKIQLYHIVKSIEPKLVVLDTLRNFYPMAIQDNAQAAAMIKELRKYSGETNCSWMIIHHLRKGDREERANNTRPTIRRDVHSWMEEVAGMYALVNNTDLRLGWEKGQGAGAHDLWLGGFLRVYGQVGPFKVSRDLDENGDPTGYRLCTPREQLSSQEQILFDALPKGEFTFNFIVDNLKRSRSTASRMIRHCLDLRLIELVREEQRVDGAPGRTVKVYRKISYDSEQ